MKFFEILLPRGQDGASPPSPSPEVPARMDECPLDCEALGRPHDVSDPHVDQQVGGQHAVTTHRAVWPIQGYMGHFIIHDISCQVGVK